MTSPNAPVAGTEERMPDGIGNAYAFHFGNTVCFTIVLGAPMILFFKNLGATATILGIVAALTPLLVILQIPAARFVELVGYRAFVLRGWALRSLFIFGMVVVAFLPSGFDSTTRIVLMLFFLFGFNILRGISSCGFLPWITHLVPESLRGRYLAREQLCISSASICCMLASSFYFSQVTSAFRFGWVFLLGLGGAIFSLVFLARIPDVPVTPSAQSNQPIPWKEMVFFPPFFKFMVFNVAYNTAIAAASVFWIPFFKDTFLMSDSKLLLLTTLSAPVVIGVLLTFGKILDRVGSRPVLALALVFLSLHFLCWGLLGAGVLPFGWHTLIIAQFIGGAGGSLFGMANTRLIMATVPVMGRSHFFALYSVINSLTLGIMPVVWGLLLDGLTGWHVKWGYWEWNKYSLMYAVLVATMGVSQVLLHRLSEPRAMTTDTFLKELLVETPGRAVARLLTRRGMS